MQKIEEQLPYLVLNDELTIVSISPKAQQLLRTDTVCIQGEGLMTVFQFDFYSQKILLSKKCIDGVMVEAVHSIGGEFRFHFYTIDNFQTIVHIAPIIQRKDLQRELNVNEPALFNVLEASNFGLWYFSLETNETYFCTTCKRVLGFDEHLELSWDTFIGHVYHEDKSLFEGLLIARASLSKAVKLQFRMWINSTLSWFELNGQYISSHQGSLNGIQGILHDCSYEKHMIHMLNEANESRRLALEAGKIGTWRAVFENGEWKWTWDVQTNKIFKLKVEDIGNLNKWSDTVYPDDVDRVLKALEEALKTGNKFEEHYRSILHDNSLIYVLASGIVTYSHKDKSARIDGVVLDLTDTYKAKLALKQDNLKLEIQVQKRTEELKMALKHTEQASQIKSDFLAMMSHELRTPMNAIIGVLDLLEQKKNNYEEADLIEMASTSANNLVDILNDILDLNKIESGKLELDCLPFNISELVNNVIVIFNPISQQKKVRLLIHEDKMLPQTLDADGNRIRQILFNLISNAIKFSGVDNDKYENGIVNVWISWNREQDSIGKLTITVKDNGIGMSSGVQKKLFTPFTQADKSTTRKFGGTGLGLAISGRLIELMGGEVTVSSSKGVGSEFEVMIPIWSFKEFINIKFFSKAYIYSEVEMHDLLAKKLDMFNAFCNEVILKNNFELVDSIENTLHVYFCQDAQHVKEIEKIASLYGLQSILIIWERGYLRQCFEHQGFATCDIDTLTRHKLKVIIERIAKKALEVNDIDLDLEFDLPLEMNSDLAEELGTETEFRTKSILLVEDNIINQKLIKKQLKFLGYECDIAGNGQEGFQAWLKGSYALILTDCHMPIMDGYELTQKIRTYEKESHIAAIPIIAVTGAAMLGDSEYCLSIGMTDFISKPIQLAKLKNVLKRWQNA